MLAFSNLRWSQGVQMGDVHPDASTKVRRGLWSMGWAGLEDWLKKFMEPGRDFGCPDDTRWQQMTIKSSAQPHL